MRFLHTSDIHLGKRMNDVNMIEDQRYILKQIADIASEEKVDAVLIAGDIYQNSAPAAEAMEALSDFACELSALGIKLFAISGNHDSDSRVAYFSKLLHGSDVFFSEKFKGELQQFTLKDEYGEIVIHMLPFVRPVFVKRFFEDRNIESYNDAVSAVIEAAFLDTTKRNILLCHQYITGGELTESDSRAVGGLDNVEACVFDGFDYVALGHLHKPQKISRDTMRYAGSPLKYSFSEALHRKSVCIVDIKEKGNTEIKSVPLLPKHDVRTVKGKFDDIRAMPPSMDYVRVILTDEIVAPDAIVSLAGVFSNMLSFGVENSKTSSEMSVSAQGSIEDKDITEIFCDFYKMQHNGTEPLKIYIDMFSEALENVVEGDADEAR